MTHEGPPTTGPVVVLTTSSASTLAVAKSLLQDAGIRYITRNEIVGSEALFGGPMPLDLLVASGDAPAARRLLDALRSPHA